MEKHTILIKGMVCNRCMMTVKSELENIGYQSVEVSLGEASFTSSPTTYNQKELEKRLSMFGFSLLEDKKTKIVSEVKNLLEEVFNGEFDFPEGFRFTRLLTDRLDKDYETISDAFIKIEDKTIEQYMIEYRINKVKELLVYSNLTLSDIAFKLNFNSVPHLSTQFKQHTGLTPSYFKELKKAKQIQHSDQL